MSENDLAERELLQRLRTCDKPEERRRLLEELLSPYLPRITRWALRLRGGGQDAADLAQEGLLAVCGHIDGFRGNCRFSTWLFTILRNRATKFGQSERSRRERPLEDAANVMHLAAAAGETLDLQRRGERARQLLSGLSSLEARIFLLHYAEGVSLTVLDRQLGLTNRSGSKAYLVAAKRKLKQRLSREARRGRVVAGGERRDEHE